MRRSRQLLCNIHHSIHKYVKGRPVVMMMNFDLPDDLNNYLESLDRFIQSDILPLQHAHDNNRFFDHRREYSRTDWKQNGIPSTEWEQLLSESASVSIAALLHYILNGGPKNNRTRS